MIINKTDKTSNIAMKLVSLALAGKKLDEIPYSDEEMKAVYEYAKKSGIAGITYFAIEDALDEDKAFDEDSFYFDWKRMRINSYRRNLLYDKEQNAVIDFLNDNDIWYMPLKGAVVKDYYPVPDVREMNDVDILVDETKREQIKTFMESQGYERWIHDYTKEDEDGDITKGDNSDEYIKEPFFYFEFHKFLIEENSNPYLAKYYQNIKDRLVKDSDSKCGYHFTDEDFYIYMIAHAYKHFAGNGIGIRFLMDVCVYLNSHKDLDYNYIQDVLEDAGIKDFEKDAREVALMAFDLDSQTDMDSLTESQKKLYDSILGAEIFGNLETRWKNQAYKVDASGEVSKSKYYKSRLFPDDDWYRIHHPFVYKHKIVKPFFTVYRLTVRLFRGRKTIKEEMDQVGEKDA